jgi:uncharacterized protein (TIGR03083 family)
VDDREAIWGAVHRERRQLLHDLEGLARDRWQTPSLCVGWSVHDVLAHLIDAATTTRLGFVRQMLGARFDFDRANHAAVQRHRARDPQDTLAAFRSVVDRTASPPGPLATRLVEASVHGEDIRRPLKIASDYAPDHVVTALSYMARTGAGLGGGKERVRGLTLTPVDSDVRTGEGPEVRGTAIALLLAASGRPTHEGELSGPGAKTLMQRL